MRQITLHLLALNEYNLPLFSKCNCIKINKLTFLAFYHHFQVDHEEIVIVLVGSDCGMNEWTFCTTLQVNIWLRDTYGSSWFLERGIYPPNQKLLHRGPCRFSPTINMDMTLLPFSRNLIRGRGAYGLFCINNVYCGTETPGVRSILQKGKLNQHFFFLKGQNNNGYLPTCAFLY